MVKVFVDPVSDPFRPDRVMSVTELESVEASVAEDIIVTVIQLLVALFKLAL